MEEHIKDLQKKRNNPILLLKLKEVVRGACFELHKRLADKKFKELDVILQTPGGDIDAAFSIVKLLKKHATKINIIVPLYAKSAGTLICLCGDKILMSEIAELGPLDTQIQESRQGDAGYVSALDGFKALEQIQQHALENLDLASKMIIEKSGLKTSEAIALGVEFSGKTSSSLYSQLDPFTMGEYTRALEIGQRYGLMILTQYMGWPEEIAKRTIYNLIFNYPSHSFIIDMSEFRKLGFPAEQIRDEEMDVLDNIAILLQQEEDTIIKLLDIKEKKSQGKETNEKA